MRLHWKKRGMEALGVGKQFSRTWMEAFDMYRNCAPIPTNLQWDREMKGMASGIRGDVLISDDYDECQWTRTILARPAKDSLFADGKDIVDQDMGFLLPWSELVKCIPRSEVLTPKTGLVIDPDIISDGSCKTGTGSWKGQSISVTVIHPSSILIVRPIVENTCADNRYLDGVGLADELTAVPKAASIEALAKDVESIRMLSAPGNTQILRPIYRICRENSDWRRMYAPDKSGFSAGSCHVSWDIVNLDNCNDPIIRRVTEHDLSQFARSDVFPVLVKLLKRGPEEEKD